MSNGTKSVKSKAQGGLRETFGPSVIERPLLRVRFVDPSGVEQQSTLSSSWHSSERPGFGSSSSSIADGCCQPDAPCVWVEAVKLIAQKNDCTLLGVEMVQTKVVAQIC